MAASPPMKVRVNCQSDQHGSYLHISWDPPTQSNGLMFQAEYKVFVEEKSVFLNELGAWEETKDTNVLSAYNRSSLTIQGIPNSNYTIQVCVMSRDGQCGTKSRLTQVSDCYMGPNLPEQLPRFTWRKLKSSEKNQIFKVLLVRASERYGPICCYRVVIVRYGDLQGRELPYPQEISVSTYREAHNHRGQHLTGYIAEMIDSNRFQDEVIVGDGSLSVPPPQCSACYSQSYANFDEAGFSRNRRYTLTSFPIVEDGPLESNSTYSGFIEVIVKTLTGDVVRKPSGYFTLLGSSDQESAVLHATILDKSSVSENEKKTGGISRESTISAVSAAAISVVALTVGSISYYRFRKEKARNIALSKEETERFLRGQPESLNPTMGLGQQAHLLPFDENWNFPSAKLKLGKVPDPKSGEFVLKEDYIAIGEVIGCGQFGYVLKAVAVGICPPEPESKNEFWIIEVIGLKPLPMRPANQINYISS
ncbi:unnamed protein product [Darwinula stevensoni]|uniref:Fibronectin type-III domain-containing protein n=1 Tax=Darwinula stevensoni TaxID=69355 RepID=A0A7R8X6I5_9CRUS|nr:unnamed protein product [Darwinula stevensoni]CAG0885919.1 unnamed protein product [Darwinula stevensoni]